MTNPTQSETLLPCPFCGHEAVVVSDNGRGLMFNVHCGKCRASGPWERCASDAKHEWNTRLQSIPEPLLDEGLVSVRIDPATAQTLMDWNVLHTTDAGWVIDLDIWRSALSIPRLEAGSHDALVRDLRRHAFDDCGGIPPRTHLAIQAADEIERLRAIPRLEAGRVTEAMIEATAREWLGNPPYPPCRERLHTVRQVLEARQRAGLAMSSASAPDGLPLVERMRDLPRLIELQREGTIDDLRDEGWNAGLERAAAMVSAALTELEEKSDG